MTEQQLKAITGAKDSLVAQFLPHINATLDEFGISSALQRAHFMSQISHESGGLRYTEELATGEDYEGRADLGNTQSGDGVKFKGRGLIQITGRSNYTSLGTDLGQNLTDGNNNLLLAQPELASRSAGWFWAKRGLNTPADADDCLKITRTINGGYNGLHDRLKYLCKAYEAFGVDNTGDRLKVFTDAIKTNLNKVTPLVAPEKVIDNANERRIAKSGTSAEKEDLKKFKDKLKKLAKDKTISGSDRSMFLDIRTGAELDNLKKELGLV